MFCRSAAYFTTFNKKDWGRPWANRVPPPRGASIGEWMSGFRHELAAEIIGLPSALDVNLCVLQCAVAYRDFILGVWSITDQP